MNITPDTLCQSVEPPDALCWSADPPNTFCRSADPPNALCRSTEPPDALCWSADPPNTLCRSTEPPDALYRSADPPNALCRSTEPPEMSDLGRSTCRPYWCVVWNASYYQLSQQSTFRTVTTATHTPASASWASVLPGIQRNNTPPPPNRGYSTVDWWICDNNLPPPPPPHRGYSTVDWWICDGITNKCPVLRATDSGTAHCSARPPRNYPLSPS